MEKRLISVIIPVYNTARWLPQCLDSVLGQDHRELEVILVNDASTDDSLAVCRDYAAKDDRIVLIDKPLNEGVEQARRSGCALAGGTYVMYVDSDDWLEHSGVLSAMYARAEETGADYVEVRIQRVLDRKKRFAVPYPYPVTGEIGQPELFDRYFLSFFGVHLLFVNVFGKLYRKAALDRASIAATGLRMGEDLAYNMQLFPVLHKICILDEVGYNYRYGGLTSRYNPYFLPDSKRLYRLKAAQLEKYGYDKASDWACIELKNALKTEVYQRIAFGTGGGKNAVTAWIRTEMNDPVYACFRRVDSRSPFWENPFVQAFMAGDAEKMYDICRSQVRKERPGRLLKRLAYWLLHLI